MIILIVIGTVMGIVGTAIGCLTIWTSEEYKRVCDDVRNKKYFKTTTFSRYVLRRKLVYKDKKRQIVESTIGELVKEDHIFYLSHLKFIRDIRNLRRLETSLLLAVEPTNNKLVKRMKLERSE